MNKKMNKKYIKDKRDGITLINLDDEIPPEEEFTIEINPNLLVFFGITQILIGFFIIFLLIMLFGG